jgi:hypothetical protein
MRSLYTANYISAVCMACRDRLRRCKALLKHRKRSGSQKCIQGSGQHFGEGVGPVASHGLFPYRSCVLRRVVRHANQRCSDLTFAGRPASDAVATNRIRVRGRQRNRPPGRLAWLTQTLAIQSGQRGLVDASYRRCTGRIPF